jgi:hypothetical protein
LETSSKDPCPCGSGKRYKHCCKERDLKKKNNYQYLFFLLPVVIVAIGLILWSQRSDRPTFRQALTGQSATGGTASQDQSPLPDGRSPEAWEFDGPRDRYWDPNHNHWHDGPPPPEGQRTVGAPANAPQTTNANIPNPEPWQFDPETNRHFDPGHKHWHQGPAPPEDQRTASSTTATTTTTTTTPAGTNPDIPNPTPYQYDPVTNQYWDPGHAHWHRGTPPADQAEGGAATEAIPEGGGSGQ